MNPNPGTTTIPPITFNLRYPGQYADVESGLYYNYFRSYNSDTGGYPQADPIGLAGSWNKFSYVDGNPLPFTDTYGLLSVADIFPEDAPILAIGNAYGALAAYGIGKLTGNEALAREGMNGLQCTREATMDVLMIMLSMGRGAGKLNAPRGTLARGPGGEYLAHPGAVGPHSTIGTRIGSDGMPYRQGATFDGSGNFRGRTDVTNHGSPQRPGHTNPHHHPATGPASTGAPVPGPLPLF